MQDLSAMLTKLVNFVSVDFCQKLAKQCQLVQRSTSQIVGYEFLQAMIIPNAFIEAETLHSLAARMHTINKNCNITASALSQRINTPKTHRFMKACFEHVLADVIRKEFNGMNDLSNLSFFNRVLIEDSTRAELHEKLSSFFKGSGGVASKASLKIDYTFDYLTEQFVHLNFCSGNKPDQSLANLITPLLQKGDLIVRDLGYFVLDKLLEIEKKGAYYISRWKVNEDVYESAEATKPLNLPKFLDKHMMKGKFDKIVYVGKNRQPVRMIACLLDEEAINKRRREANRSASRHGVTTSKKKTALMKYSIFITNIPNEVLCGNSIMAIYRARWRVELIFKQWKSCLKLHIFKGYNKEGFYCFLYGRLIMILIMGAMCPIVMAYASKLGRELSCYKFTNYVIADHGFARMVQKGQINEYIDRLVVDIPRRLCMDKRKRLSLRSNVRSNTSYYNELKIRGLDEQAA